MRAQPRGRRTARWQTPTTYAGREPSASSASERSRSGGRRRGAVPRTDHPYQPHPDPADVRPRLQDPVQDAWAVLDLLAEVSVEHDVHRPGQIHLALERQPDVLRA